MKLEGLKITRERVEVDVLDSEIKELCMKMFDDMFDLPTCPFIKGDELWTEFEERGGSHSWYEKDKYREKEEIDEAAIKIRQVFRKRLQAWSERK